MKVIHSADEMASLADAWRRSGRRIGLVPTMGYLHDGHLSLVRDCAARCEVCVVSVFVNPTQFGPNEDYTRYPRDLERDCRVCRDAGVHAVFAPPAEVMYAPDASTRITEQTLSRGLCGAFRPGHFTGVCTVVAKLFNIVCPDVAVFGRKDAQQLAIIRRMARDLNFHLEIVGAPIVREPDGLAMSSRNVMLSPLQRAQAVGLSRALTDAEMAVRGGERDPGRLRSLMETRLQADYPEVRVEYIVCVDADTLDPVDKVRPGSLVAIAARVGETRLIDNLLAP